VWCSLKTNCAGSRKNPPTRRRATDSKSVLAQFKNFLDGLLEAAPPQGRAVGIGRSII
jgi:hypothetical protein